MSLTEANLKINKAAVNALESIFKDMNGSDLDSISEVLVTMSYFVLTQDKKLPLDLSINNAKLFHKQLITAISHTQVNVQNIEKCGKLM